MTTVVLDASAVLALLANEQGAEAVEPHVPGGSISAVNLTEVVSKLLDRQIDELTARQVVRDLGLQVVSFNETAALVAAGLRLATKDAGLSLGDCACLALGLTLKCSVLTADRTWAGLNLGIDVAVIR